MGVRSLGAVDLSWLFLPQFIDYFNKAKAMPFGYSPQIAYNTVKIAKKRGPLGAIQCIYSFMTRMWHSFHLASLASSLKPYTRRIIPYAKESNKT